MQTITRKKGAFDNLYFEVDLTAYGKTGDDVEDIFFSIKESHASADDVLFFKTKGAGEISFTETNNILNVAVQWGNDEYSTLKTSKEYTAGLFIKFTGDPVADEHVDQLFKLVIEPDFLRA